MTALSGLASYLELAHAAGLGESVRLHMGDRKRRQDWTYEQMITLVTWALGPLAVQMPITWVPGLPAGKRALMSPQE